MVSRAIRDGDLAKLHSWIDDPSGISDSVRFTLLKAYRDLVTELILSRRNYLNREELYIIFVATVGKVPIESAKFTQYLKHHAVVLTQIKRNNNDNTEYLIFNI